jgi:hypothetical protein
VTTSVTRKRTKLEKKRVMSCAYSSISADETRGSSTEHYMGEEFKIRTCAYMNLFVVTILGILLRKRWRAAGFGADHSLFAVSSFPRGTSLEFTCSRSSSVKQKRHWKMMLAWKEDITSMGYFSFRGTRGAVLGPGNLFAHY